MDSHLTHLFFILFRVVPSGNLHEISYGSATETAWFKCQTMNITCGAIVAQDISGEDVATVTLDTVLSPLRLGPGL